MIIWNFWEIFRKFLLASVHFDPNSCVNFYNFLELSWGKRKYQIPIVLLPPLTKFYLPTIKLHKLPARPQSYHLSLLPTLFLMLFFRLLFFLFLILPLQSQILFTTTKLTRSAFPSSWASISLLALIACSHILVHPFISSATALAYRTPWKSRDIQPSPTLLHLYGRGKHSAKTLQLLRCSQRVIDQPLVLYHYTILVKILEKQTWTKTSGVYTVTSRTFCA